MRWLDTSSAAVPGVVSVVSRRGETHVDVVGKRSVDRERADGDVGRDDIPHLVDDKADHRGGGSPVDLVE
jgi:hypothetical protein